MPSTPFKGSDLQLELVDPNSFKLFRLFRWPNGEWEAPEPQHRQLRVDPPPGNESDFAILYTTDTVQCAASECRILAADVNDRWSYDKTRADSYKVATYTIKNPAIFIPIDGSNRTKLGLDPSGLRLGSYLPYQQLSLQLYTRYGSIVHGLSWASMHRNQLGRVYAIWHHRKDDVISRPDPTGLKPLNDHAAWTDFLSKNTVQPVATSPP